MDFFARRAGELHAEDVPLAEIATRHGTPTYVYSRATLERHVRVLAEGLRGLDPLICYAVKANGTMAVLEILSRAGCGFDAVSRGELARLQRLGVPPARVIVSGVGKRDDEIEAALHADVLYLGVESASELEAVARIAARMGKRAPVALRVNPDVDARTHPHVATGLKENKFGVPIAEARALYHHALVQLPAVEMVGVTCHIGSQITALAPFIDATRLLADLARGLMQDGAPLRYVGAGGGLGVTYHDETPPSPDAYGQALATALSPLGLRLVLEPGRVLVGNAGVLLTRVVRVKDGPAGRFVIVDAGMNDLIRPALYGAYHHLEPVAAPRTARRAVTVVGPVCESADTFARERDLPELAEGDLLVVRTAGAYCAAMSSQYNGRPRAAEVLCDGGSALLVRERESFDDLWRHERALDGTPYVRSP